MTARAEIPVVPTPMNVARRPGTSYRYESLWMRLHKFAFLNAAGYHCLRRILIGEMDYSPMTNQRWLGHFGKMLPEQLAAALAITPEELELSVYKPYEIPPNVSDVEYRLRYCHVCMEQGFHCAVFQMRWVKRCPIHGVPLQNRCRYCGAFNAYLFIPEAFKKAGHCACGVPFWPNLVADVWPAVDDSVHEAVFGELVRWVKWMRRTALGGHCPRRFADSISVPALATVAPIPGWRLRDFGLTRDCVTTSTYTGPGLPLRPAHDRPDLQVIAIRALKDRPYPHDIYAWLMPLYRERAKQVHQKLLQRIGRHADCAKETGMHGNMVYFQDRLCIWAWAIKGWEHDLTRDRLLHHQKSKHPLEWMRVTMEESYDYALRTIQWLHGAEFDDRHPIVVWLALEIFEAELLYQFLWWLDHAITVTEFQRKYHVYQWPCLKRLSFAIMYAPIASGAKPEARFYFGVPLETEIFPLAEKGVGCFNNSAGLNTGR